MANLFETLNKKFTNLYDYVKKSTWFASRSLDYKKNKTKVDEKFINATREVLYEGKRFVGLDVNEHDCIGDILWVSTTNNKSDRKAYIPGKTFIYNKYCSKYVFLGFAPGGGDPFGVKVSERFFDASLCNVDENNIINTSKPIKIGKKYTVSDDDLALLAYIASREQDSEGRIKIEVSLMANLFEKYGKKYKKLIDYVKNSKLFASRSADTYDEKKKPDEKYIKAVREVLVEGKRFVDSYVNVRDSIENITSVSIIFQDLLDFITVMVRSMFSLVLLLGKLEMFMELKIIIH